MKIALRSTITIHLAAATLMFQTVSAADEPRSNQTVIAGYQEALDHITREFLYMLEKKNLLVVWCFDESESMKDDQAEIRARLNRVYEELALAKIPKDALLSSVVSYGDRISVQTRKPIVDAKKIKDAISAIPTDRSGKERMCQTIFRAITWHRGQAAAE